MTHRRPVPRQLSRVEQINPFTHKIELTWLEKLQVALMSVTIAPIRLLFIIVLMLFTYVIAAIVVKTVPEKDRGKPMTGWRKFMKKPAAWLARATFFGFGFHYIKVKGREAPTSEAPIMCCGPHTSFADIIIAFVLEEGMPSGVSRYETSLTPIAGMLTRLTEPVYVKRDDPDSRRHTIEEIERRARGDWPRVLVFPEGTVGNGSCLMSFKQGGFVPGLPVQPVCLRYTNRLNTTAWTWDGPSAYELMWLTLCQFHNGCEITFLPAYHPNEAEKADYKLFARNVRAAMAKVLNVPVTDTTFEDCKLKMRSEPLYPPIVHGLVELQVLQRKNGYYPNMTKEFLDKNSSQQNIPRTIKVEEFAEKLERPMTEDLQQLFRLFDRDKSGQIDFVDYLVGISVISNVDSPGATLELVFKSLVLQLLGNADSGCMKVEDLNHVLHDVYGVDDADLHKLWNDLDKTNNCMVSLDEFQSYAEGNKSFRRIFKNSNKKEATSDANETVKKKE